MRIGGLATGMDTHQIIDDLMRAERMPLNKHLQRKQTIEWQRDAYREVNLQISTFRESMRAKGLALQSTFFQKKITSSNPNAVTAVAAGNPANVTNRLQVHQLATAATWSGSNITQDSVKTNQAIDWFTNTGPEGEISTEESVFDANGNFTLKLKVTNPDGTINEPQITIRETDRMSDVMRKINTSGLGLTAFFDTQTSQVVLSNKQTGAGSRVETLDSGSAKFMEKLGFSAPEVGGFGSIGSPINGTGTNADFTINGHRTERTSNTFTINEVRYTLNEVTTGPVNISLATDTDKIYDAIMKFVEDYNNLVDAINGKLREDRHRDFPPLTDDQREAMSEKEIEKWEEKAMSGLLRNDSILSSGLSQMRMQVFGGVGGDNIGAFKHLSQIGLVGTKDYFDGGKIILDPERMSVADGRRLTGEERLREAIENDPEGLFKLFMADGETREEQGIIRRLRTSLDSTMERINQRAGREGRANHQFTLGREMTQLDNRVSNFERRLQDIEQRYWRQFTAMEKAIQQMNSQAEQMFSMMFGNMM